MGFYDQYKGIFDQIKLELEELKIFKQIFLGEKIRLQSFPLAVINPLENSMNKPFASDLIENRVGVEIYVIIRETEPENWFEDVIVPLCTVLDKLMSDSTLNGKVKDLIPRLLSPGEIRFSNKMFYGGLIRLEALMYYNPSG